MNTTIDFGIDLGTTNSCVARWENGAMRVYQNSDQMNVTPSAVHIFKTGRVIVGRRAYQALITDPDNVAIEFKRWMGQNDRKTFPATGRLLSAEDLSAEILKALKEDVRRQTGVDMRAAVITVPAAFGALQCEATARAAALAGFDEAPLLQEPIAAAIGYGASPQDAAEKWLVFDLGGGTLDIAVVSTRDGRLNVLEHRGDNVLGGKDIDKLIVGQVILPALKSAFDLPDLAVGDPAAQGLMSRLRLKAEEAKIDLSTAEDVVLSIYDVGDDRSGTPIEMEIPMSRRQLHALCEPLYARCCGLAREALAAARLSGADLSRILLVGGPTQSPTLRAMLQDELRAPIDFSADPMTIVGKGAAIYASTLERTAVKAAVAATAVEDEGEGKAVQLKLAYEAVSADHQCAVAGRVLKGPADLQIKIEAAGGVWTSGWVTPSAGFFDVTVSLVQGGVTTFWLYARDGQGNALDTDVEEFRIRHGLVPSAPPLPHTISVEVVTPTGKAALDSIFAKGTPLPAERTLAYRAVRALSPQDPKSGLAIKLWEGEFLEMPEANDWIGNVVIEPRDVRRSVPQGAEIEVSLRINESRMITVDVFIAHLNQSFSETVYVSQGNAQDFSDMVQNVGGDLAVIEEKIGDISQAAAHSDNAAVTEELAALRRQLAQVQSLQSAILSQSENAGAADPDDTRRVVQDAKTLKGRIHRAEASLTDTGVTSGRHFDLVEAVDDIVGQYGTALEKQQVTLLKKELERATAKGDTRSVSRVVDEFETLRWRVLGRQDWFLRDVFNNQTADSVVYLDPERAKSLIKQGYAAISADDSDALRRIVVQLSDLQPKGQVEAARESAMLAGLRK